MATCDCNSTFSDEVQMGEQVCAHVCVYASPCVPHGPLWHPRHVLTCAHKPHAQPFLGDPLRGATWSGKDSEFQTGATVGHGTMKQGGLVGTKSAALTISKVPYFFFPRVRDPPTRCPGLGLWKIHKQLPPSQVPSLTLPPKCPDGARDIIATYPHPSTPHGSEPWNTFQAML